jgi:hypothetical protein
MSTALPIQSSTPAITTDSLRALVEHYSRRHPELTSRLEKAATIVLLRDIVYYGNGFWHVESECQPGQWYIVDARMKTCTCPDRQHRSPICKHLIAVKLYALAREQAKATAQRRPLVARVSGSAIADLLQCVAAPEIVWTRQLAPTFQALGIAPRLRLVKRAERVA